VLHYAGAAEREDDVTDPNGARGARDDRETPVGAGGASVAPSQPGFAPPSDPGFAPPSDPGFAAPSQPGFRPPSQPGPGLPHAGSVPFTPHGQRSSGAAVAALVLSIAGAVLGLAIGWGFPLSIVALVLALRARRAPGPSRTLSRWSIALVVVSAVASVAWLVYSLVTLVTLLA
jgi:hypothetical protein